MATLELAVDAEGSEPSEGIEENRDADQDDRSPRLSPRRDNRGGRMERTDGRERRPLEPVRESSVSLPPSTSSSYRPTSSILCVAGGPSTARGGPEGVVSETDLRRRGTVSTFSTGRGCVAVAGVIGRGDPLRDAGSKNAGSGDSSPGGGVVLITRNCLRCGVGALGRRSPLALRGGEIGDFAGVLGEPCSACTGEG